MDFFEQVKRLKTKYQKMYIYGAGLYGRNIFRVLNDNGIYTDGFIVTNNVHEKELFGQPVIEVDNIDLQSIGIILGVNRHNAKEIGETLKKKNIPEDHIVNGSEYIDKDGIRGGYDEKPAMEITPVIGCSVNCKYCPQDALLGAYYSSDRNRTRMMNISLFRECLDKLPKECTIIFCGMAEPFLNPNCLEMIDIACKSGHVVNLYTTLVGLDEGGVQKLISLPIEFVVLHVADKYGYATIPVDEDYYNKIETILAARDVNGHSFVNICNAQDEPLDRVKDICTLYGYKVLTALFDRAGLLEGDNLYGKKGLQGKIKCSFCGTELNHNILLPDGTVLLCCMDYGMKHVLGNLHEQSYEELMTGQVIQYVKNGMEKDETVDILCRNCSCANICV